MKTSSYLLAGSVDDLSFWVRENFDERHQTFWGGRGGGIVSVVMPDGVTAANWSLQ